MGHYDELDHEIDQEMGWADGKKRPRSKARAGRGAEYWQAILRTARASSPIWWLIGNIFHGISKVVFFPIISPLGYAKHFNVEGDMVVIRRSWFWRVADALLTRILLTPVILAIFLIAVVYTSTHPRTVHAISTPESYGLYYKRINLVSIDNQRLTGWYVPPLSVDQLAFDPEGSLAQKWPAVVVCHGLGEAHDQYLPLAKTLHDAGFAVLLVDTRGQGESDPAAITYGLRERLDVLAAVKYLRETAYIDETKVCVVGHDIGATAVLQAATLDSAIAAVVADGLWPRFEDRARDIFTRAPANWTWLSSGNMSNGGPRLPTAWLASLYTMTFEIAVRDSLSQLDPIRVLRSIHTQPVLFIARTGDVYAPLQDVLAYASTEGSKHEVYIDNPNIEGDSEERIRNFLVKVTGWKGPSSSHSDQMKNLLQSEIK